MILADKIRSGGGGGLAPVEILVNNAEAVSRELNIVDHGLGTNVQ